MYEFKIATQAAGVGALATLASLGLKDPRFDFASYTTLVVLGDGTTLGVGAPVVEWHWGFMTEAQRNTLHSYVGSASSAFVYICTPDASLTNRNYLAVMNWPLREIKSGGRVIDLAVRFTFMVQQ